MGKLFEFFRSFDKKIMSDSEEKVGNTESDIKKTNIEEKITSFESEVLSFTAVFQKYRNFVMVFVISMPIHCVILEVEVNFFIF